MGYSLHANEVPFSTFRVSAAYLTRELAGRCGAHAHKAGAARKRYAAAKVYVALVNSALTSTNHGAPCDGKNGLGPMATANPSISESAIEQITAGRGPHYEPFGWHHWPEYRRSIPGSPTNFAGRSVKPRKGRQRQRGDAGGIADNSGRSGKLARRVDAIADRNRGRGLAEEKSGHVRTAMNRFQRAANYCRQAEFHLEPDDPGARGLRRSASSIGFLRRPTLGIY